MTRHPKMQSKFRILALFMIAIACLFATSTTASQEVAPDFLFEKNVQILTRDGSWVMANVFRPAAEGRYPVLMSMSIYGKDIHTRDFNPDVWEEMREHISGLCTQSSCEYHTWETPDPEVWVAEGYVVIRIDSRGSGKTPGMLDPFSPDEIRDYYDAIEWAGVQPWSNGKVGLSGISYYATTQWQVAALQPPHLAAIAPWEGAIDAYRDISRHGGILSNVFQEQWAKRRIIPLQHGNTDGPFHDMDDGAPAGGPTSLSKEERAQNRVSPLVRPLTHALDDEVYRTRTPDLDDIHVPLLSSANWGGFGMHERGNFNGFSHAASSQKWLDVHTGDHVAPFYSEEGRALQKQFYDHFLKGEANGWDKRPPIVMDIRQVDGTIERREEHEWPLARTEWRSLYLDASSGGLGSVSPEETSQVEYKALKQSASFTTLPLDEQLEINGPMAAKLWVSSSTEDMDLFMTVQAFDSGGREVTFPGANDPAAPIAQGWLRVSQRKLDSQKSKPWQPYHSHDEKQPLEAGTLYEVDVEIWPGQVVLAAGSTLRLRIEGRDFMRPRTGLFGWITDLIMDDLLDLNIRRGSGFSLHNHPQDRPAKIFGGIHTIHTGGGHPSHILLPVIPSAP